MRNSILFFGLLCLNLHIQAQSDKNTKNPKGNTHHKKWVQCFLVTVKGDTIHGKIRDMISPPFYDIQYNLPFDGPDGMTRNYTPDSLSSFTVFRNKKGEVDTATYVAMEIKDDLIGHAFLRLYVDGPCKIYGYTTVVASGMTSFNIVEYKYIRVGRGLMVPPKRFKFKKDMKEVFVECPLIISNLDSGDYTFDNWQDMVKDYNRGLCK